MDKQSKDVELLGYSSTHLVVVFTKILNKFFFEHHKTKLQQQNPGGELRKYILYISNIISEMSLNENGRKFKV